MARVGLGLRSASDVDALNNGDGDVIDRVLKGAGERLSV